MSFFSRKDLPFKVVRHDPEAQNYKIISSKWNFAEAYNYADGTHVIQTHGTDVDLERMVRGEVSSSTEGLSAAKRAGVGFLLGGPVGAALGAAASGSKHGKWYELPAPIITDRPPKA
jgi:hypothetical protein